MLLAGHLPRRREPQPQRRPSAVKDRPRRDRRLTPAHRTLPTTTAQSPTSPTHAPRATEPVRPAQPLQIVQARSLVRKPRQQLRVRAGVILARLRHIASLPELDRYPPCHESSSRGVVPLRRGAAARDRSAPRAVGPASVVPASWSRAAGLAMRAGSEVWPAGANAKRGGCDNCAISSPRSSFGARPSAIINRLALATFMRRFGAPALPVPRNARSKSA